MATDVCVSVCARHASNGIIYSAYFLSVAKEIISNKNSQGLDRNEWYIFVEIWKMLYFARPKIEHQEKRKKWTCASERVWNCTKTAFTQQFYGDTTKHRHFVRFNFEIAIDVVFLFASRIIWWVDNCFVVVAVFFVRFALVNPCKPKIKFRHYKYM